MSDLEIASTRRALVASQRWRDMCGKLDIVALGEAGPIDMDGWGMSTHLAVRAWACPWPWQRGADMPAVLGSYFARIESAGTEGGA